jgi:hemoglobin
MKQPIPYRSTPIFTNVTLPKALRRAHSTKADVWGKLKVLKGTILYVIEETGECQMVQAPGTVVILPQQLHSVEPQGDMEMQVDFYHEAPEPKPATICPDA